MTLTPYHDYHVGQDVVCVNDGILHEQYLGVRAGETYRVAWVGPVTSYMSGAYTGVRLEGVNRGVCPQFGDIDLPFRASRFRPVAKPSAPARELEEVL